MSRLGIKVLHLPTLLLRPGVRFILASLLFFGTLLLAYYFIGIEKYRHELDNKEYTQKLASKIRHNIEFQINHTMHLSQGLALLSVQYDTTHHLFDKISAEILKSAPFIRNVALAKDNIITQIYPLEGNEKALGLRYMDAPSQRDDIIRAIETKKSVLAGPIDLVQGGRGIINRIPIFHGKNNDDYWGIASLVVDVDTFLERSGFLPEHPELELALMTKNSQMIFGDKLLFTHPQHVLLPIQFVADTWYLAAVSKNGYQPENNLFLFEISSVIIASILAFLLFFLLKSYETIHFQSLHDPLTSLPNLRLFYETLQQFIYHAKREKSSFAVLFMDIDKFKDINDTLGHKVGDLVLKEVSKRLKMILRESDTVARVGGDEFVVLLKYSNSNEEVEHVIKKIKDAIKAPLTVSKETLHIKISIGYAFYPKDAQSVTELITMADKKMFVEKFDRG